MTPSSIAYHEKYPTYILLGGTGGRIEFEAGQPLQHVLGWKFMSCSHVKSWVNFWILIGFALLYSQSGDSLLVDTTLDMQ